MFGYDRDSISGILLSIEILNDIEKRANAYSKTNKAKQAGRKSRAPSRPHKRHK